MRGALSRLWYERHPLRWLLWPFSLLYRALAACRWYRMKRAQVVWPVPIIVVGNLTVGGVGKTPLVIALVEAFVAKGFRVGIVSRGYGGGVGRGPYEVKPTDTAALVGDEPRLLADKTNCPVVIAKQRNEAVRYLLAHHHSQVIVSDDGLQHIAMGRAIEIAVVDARRGFGNGLCLPAGPLREKVGRLKQVDFVIVNGEGLITLPEGVSFTRMILEPGMLRPLIPGSPAFPVTEPTAAIAGIGHPQRFFDTLEALGLLVQPYSFPDHHPFQKKDLVFSEKTVVMTEKDAVKCKRFATDRMYVLPVMAVLEPSFWDALWASLSLSGSCEQSSKLLVKDSETMTEAP